MKNNESKPWQAMIKGLITSYGLTIIILLLLSVLVTYTSITEECTTAVAVTTTIIAVFLYGFKTAVSAGSKGWLWGISSGIIYIGIMLLIGFLTIEGYAIGIKALIMVGVAVAGGGIGGILGVNRR